MSEEQKKHSNLFVCTDLECEQCKNIRHEPITLQQQEEAHLELAIKYYTQGFEDARSKTYIAFFSADGLGLDREERFECLNYKTLEDGLQARGLK